VGIELVTIDLSNIYPDGYQINLAALDWLNMVANPLQRGYLVTSDYGYPAERYYSLARQQGRYSAITNISAITTHKYRAARHNSSCGLLPL